MREYLRQGPNQDIGEMNKEVEGHTYHIKMLLPTDIHSIKADNRAS